MLLHSKGDTMNEYRNYAQERRDEMADILDTRLIRPVYRGIKSFTPAVLLFLVASLVEGCTTVTLRTPNCEASFEHIAGFTGVQRMETTNCYFEIRG